MGLPPKRMNFWKSFKGGVIFNPKISVTDFGPLKLNRAFEHEKGKKIATRFSEKGGGDKFCLGLGGVTRPFARNHSEGTFQSAEKSQVLTWPSA